MTSRCLLFSQESRRRAEHLTKGEDPDDLEIVLNDVAENFKEALEMIRQGASDYGIDLDQECVEEIDRVDISTHPLHSKAKSLSWSIHHFQKKFAVLLQEERLKGSKEENIATLEEDYQILAWYCFQITVKIDRALHTIMGKERSSDDLYDAEGSAKVAWIGLSKCLDSLASIDRMVPWLNSETIPLIEKVYEVINLLDEAVPEYKTFRRPGLDD